MLNGKSSVLRGLGPILTKTSFETLLRVLVTYLIPTIPPIYNPTKMISSSGKSLMIASISSVNKSTVYYPGGLSDSPVPLMSTVITLYFCEK